MKHILVTGGAGFIGSHTCVELLEKKYNITIVDSFINSSPVSIDKVKKIVNKSKFYLNNHIELIEGDIRNKSFLENLFHNNKNKGNSFDAVIHFAGLKSIKESILNPSDYWFTNVIGTFNLVKAMEENYCHTLIFSSSASVYKVLKDGKYIENSNILPDNPYGETKATVEKFLKNIFNSDNKKWKIGCIRYFNPIGAHESGLIGENPQINHNNIFPLINNVAIGRAEKLNIFGKDWPTKDGTPVRDYIHVMDVAQGHIKVLEYLESSEPQILNLNLGTGIGTSILELIDTYKEVNKIQIPYDFVDRRIGDVATLIADNSLAYSLLGWKPQKSLEQMCIDGWKWISRNPYGFD
ncbi:UDP-glucose 4-epimerase GalE [Prochlorococcus sp. AH-736-K21]|nr:UDP-glucose 4-epimerase GalE [Prochlorococcus sp. AH-736-K21]MDA9707773.1 UDP-glucose 4-epimerase GalE [Prochlorococcus sp. AH-736-K21]